MSSTIHSSISYGADGLSVAIECHLSNSLPNIVIVGAANRTVDEAKERIRSAFANSGLTMPRRRITINLAPADAPKDSSSLDLAIATAILAADGQLRQSPGPDNHIIGELGLDGQVRPVRGIIGKLLCGRRNGVRRFFIPATNMEQAGIVPDIELVPVASLAALYGHFDGQQALPANVTVSPAQTPPQGDDDNLATDPLAGIIGQEQAKRALAVAAAGGHNLLLSGPPGTGKSLLAKALAKLLPPMSHEEMLEVTHLHSLSGHDYEKLVTDRPVRSPHHSASHVAVVGGGASVRPGEVSLAHHGVLFFDELPEFHRLTIESLRQPLEDHTITVSRARDSITYPAHFIFVATANPCPCGYYGTSSKPCSCTLNAVRQYRQKLSGPLLDRIDLHVSASQVDHSSLLSSTPVKNADELSTSIIRLVEQARDSQHRRYGNRLSLNSTMDAAAIRRYAYPSPSAKRMLDRSAAQNNLSARAYMRCLRVARTIADMNDSELVDSEHIGEALRYRQLTDITEA